MVGKGLLVGGLSSHGDAFEGPQELIRTLHASICHSSSPPLPFPFIFTELQGFLNGSRDLEACESLWFQGCIIYSELHEAFGEDPGEAMGAEAVLRRRVEQLEAALSNSESRVHELEGTLATPGA